MNSLLVVMCLLGLMGCMQENTPRETSHIVILKQHEYYFVDEGEIDAVFTMDYLDRFDDEPLDNIFYVSDSKIETTSETTMVQKIRTWCEENDVTFIYWSPHSVRKKDCDHCDYLDEREIKREK
ncbi:hypothetical protein JD969_15280 [Planctomycetota bacterium]|nr:hypothetical protein JD969_15280 [Planctomycetota bacterium]